jgi:hypothetical protein
MKNLFLLFCFTILLFSCKKGSYNEISDKEENINVRNYELKKENRNILKNYIDSVSFLEIKEQGGHYFSSINKLIINDDHIFIFDILGSHTLLMFNKKGDFIRQIGMKGSGPHEYAMLWDFDIDSLYIYLYDRAKQKIFKYDFDGKFCDEKKLPFRADAFKILENNKYLFSLAKENTKYRLVLTDKDFNIEKHYFPYDDKDMDDKITDNIFQETNNIIIYNKPVNDNIYVFSKYGELLEGYYFDFGSQKVPDKLRYSYEELAKKRKNENYIYYYDAPIIINNLLIGKIFCGMNKATFLYDMESEEYLIKILNTNTFDFSDICLPVFANDQYIVSWIDINIYESMKTKAVLSESMIKNLETGGRILCFHHLK